MRTSYSPGSCPLLSLFLVPLLAAASNLWTFFAFQYLYLAFFFLEIYYGQGTRWGGILGNRSSSLYFKRSLQSRIEYSSQKPNNSMCNGFRLSLSGKKKNLVISQNHSLGDCGVYNQHSQVYCGWCLRSFVSDIHGFIGKTISFTSDWTEWKDPENLMFCPLLEASLPQESPDCRSDGFKIGWSWNT